MPGTQESMGDGGRRLKLREFVRTTLRQKGDTRDFADGELLRTTGRLDSLDIVDLVTFVEQEFGLDFREAVFDPDDFDSIDSLAALVAQPASGSR